MEQLELQLVSRWLPYYGYHPYYGNAAWHGGYYGGYNHYGYHPYNNGYNRRQRLSPQLQHGYQH